MEINFTQVGDNYVSEFEATGDFNLHIDGVLEGNVSVYQRGTSSGGYAFVRGSTPSPSYGNVYDYDFSALVYPKSIKVVCANKPTMAVVTMGA